jgi:hypothetical protein
MKKVFSNASDVIHLFAQRTQDEARSNNVFFEYGNKLYSYGHHYLLAEFITNSKGEQAVYINNKGYSVTTSKHISWAVNGLRQYKQFYETQINPQRVLTHLETIADKLQRARKKELYINEAEHLYSKFIEYITWKEETPVLLPQINTVIELFRGKDVSVYFAEKAELIKKAEQARIRKEKAEYKKRLKKFFSHDTDYCPGENDYLRISQDGQYIETTQRVRVPIKEAVVLYKMILAGNDIKGYNISGYTVISINGVLKIGCHNINKNNMHEIGQKIMNV